MDLLFYTAPPSVSFAPRFCSASTNRSPSTTFSQTALRKPDRAFSPPHQHHRHHQCHQIRRRRRWNSPHPLFASNATSDSSGGNAPAPDLNGLYKKVLLPIIDRNPYLSDATRQAAATTTALAKKYGAEITVVVIDEDTKESIADHDLRMKNIRWHMDEGGFEEFGLIESLGEGKKPAAVIGEIADDMNLDLVVLSMESIHSKHIDGNLLAEFVPCPILLLPL